MAEAMWYHAKDGAALGPLTLAQLREMLAAGTIRPTDLLCSVGGTEWVAAQTVPGLIAPPPPLPPLPVEKRRLIPCGKCKVAISDEAETCPHCGEHQPKWEEKEYGRPGDNCVKCGVFNIVSLGYGRFLDQPFNCCRGCGCPLTEASPRLHLESEMDRVYANTKEGASFLGYVAAIICFFGYWLYYNPDASIVTRLLVAVAGYFIVSLALGALIRGLVARQVIRTRFPWAAGTAGRNWDRFAHAYQNRYAPKGAAAVANASRPKASSMVERVIGIVFVLYIAGAIAAGLFIDRGPPKPELPLHVSFRTSDVGKGMVLKMQNTSSVPLSGLSFTITNPRGQKAGQISKNLSKPLESQATFEVGWAELGGWELSPGETIKIWVPGGNYKPIEVTVPAKAPNR